MLRRTTAGAVLVVALIVLAGCADSMRVTPIPDVIENPADFNNKFVKVEGTVAKTVVDAGTGGSTRYYVLETRIQRAGKTPPYYVLKILAPSSEIPDEGKTLWVKGTIQDVPGDDPILRETERERDWRSVIWMIAFSAVGVVLIVLVIILIKTLMGKPKRKVQAGSVPAGGRGPGAATSEDLKETKVARPLHQRQSPPPTPPTPETRAATEGYLLIERGECVAPDHSGQRLIIYQDARDGLILGRGSEAEIRFKGDAVSRKHATLFWYDDDTFKLMNTCDAAKTWTTVDGQKLGPHDTVKLQHDSRIDLGGEVELVFQHRSHQT